MTQETLTARAEDIARFESWQTVQAERDAIQFEQISVAQPLENTLVIFDLEGNWMCDWKHTPAAARIADLFGGQTSLPTPYSTLVPVSKVIADVAGWNPQYKVVAAAENGLR
jgi:hypothetical protein